MYVMPLVNRRVSESHHTAYIQHSQDCYGGLGERENMRVPRRAKSTRNVLNMKYLFEKLGKMHVDLGGGPFRRPISQWRS